MIRRSSIRAPGGDWKPRAQVRKGVRSNRKPPVARRLPGLREPTMCERCGAVYRHRRWLAGSMQERLAPIRVCWTVCPACRSQEQGEYYGRVAIRGAQALAHVDEIMRRVRHVAERARFAQSQRRVISIERRGQELEVLTTSQKLAHRIARELCKAFGGEVRYSWSDQDGELLASWAWTGPVAAGAGTRR
jgi:hypothetical protein